MDNRAKSDGTRVFIMGAVRSDCRNFNAIFRANPEYRVVVGRAKQS
ncbi:MAG: hypothetical protein H8K05_07680 [Nitrospira sp.]|nr:hypothetical protein [Nitrospira sp.]